MKSYFANHQISADRKIAILNIQESGAVPHSHDYFELVYVLEGSAVQSIDGRDMEVKAGDYYVIDYDTNHSYTQCKDFHIINCLFKPEFLDKALTGCKDFDKLINNYLIHFDNNMLSRLPADSLFHDSPGEIRQLFESIEREYNCGDSGYIEMMRGHLIQILVLSLRSIYIVPAVRRHNAVRQVLEYVEDHYSEHINLSDLCREMNFSLPYISMLFRKTMGMTFQHYLQKVRIEQSCRLLTETDEKITHIANNVGYDDIKFFGKIFKSIMNMPPREFRKMTRMS